MAEMLTERVLLELREPGIRFCRTLMPRDQMEDVEDVVSTALMKAWRYRDSFGQQSSILTWFYPIIRNAVFDHLKDKRRREPISAQIVMVNPEDDYKFACPPSTGADTIAAQSELGKLAPPMRSIIEFAVDGGDFAKRDRALGLPRGVSEGRYRRAKAIVAAALAG